MIGAIPNPTRELTVPFTNEQVQVAMSNLSKYLIGTDVGNYEQKEYDAIIGQLELTKTEFLSFGVSILVTACAVGENQTKINIEVRRQIGSFDESYEVSQAKRHLDKVVKGISDLLSNPEVIKGISEEKVQEKSKSEANKTVGMFALAFISVVIYFVLNTL